MKRAISLKQKHCDSDETLLCYQGEAQVEEEENCTRFHVSMNTPAGEVEVRAFAQAAAIDSRFEQHTHLLLREGHQTYARVEGSFGTLTLPVKTESYKKTPDFVYVRYALMQDRRACDTFELRIEMGGGMK